MAFLTPADYPSQIRNDVLNTITAGNDYLQYQAEQKAQTQIISYLHHRYDVSSIFIDVPKYDNTVTYEQGDMVYYDDNGTYKLYVAKQQTTGNDPTNTTYWALNDARNKHMVRLTVDITLYLLHQANANETMPDYIKQNYEDALEWLNKAAKGEIGTDLPLITDDPGNPVRAGSDTQQSHYW